MTRNVNGRAPSAKNPDAKTPAVAADVESPGDHPPSVHERLLDAARERFYSDGYENATTACIARQAGTSESQLMKHFGSKGGLLEAIFDEAWRHLELRARSAVESRSSPLARLLAVSDVVMRAMEGDRKLRSLFLLEARRIRKHGSDVAISAGFRRFLAMIDDVFLQMQRQDDFIADVHLEAVRSAWMGANEGLLRDQLLAELVGYPATFDRRQLRRTASSVLMAFLTPRAQLMVSALWRDDHQGEPSASEGLPVARPHAGALVGRRR